MPPDNAIGAPANSGADTRDIDVLGDDTDVVEEKEPVEQDDDEEKRKPVKPPLKKSKPHDEVEPDDDTDKEDDEEVEKDEDEEEEKEDDEEPVKMAYDRPTIKEIKEKYPKLFKDFPTLKDAIFREAEYTSLFPTVEDAKNTFEDAEALSALRESALNGDPGPVLEAVEKADKSAFQQFAKKLLPEIYKKDQQVYSTIITPIFENLVRQVYRDAVKNSNEDLKNAALHLSSFLFDTDEVASGKRTFVQPDSSEKEKKIKEEREADLNRRFLRTYQEVDSEIKKSMMSLIRKDFDPDEQFSPFLRKQLMETIYHRISKQLEMDEGHLSVMRGRWKYARANGFQEEDKSKIISTFLARAKSLIPGVRSKVKEAALGKQATRKSEKSGERTVRPPKELTGGGAPNGKPAMKVDYKKMSDIDILNS